MAENAVGCSYVKPKPPDTLSIEKGNNMHMIKLDSLKFEKVSVLQPWIPLPTRANFLTDGSLEGSISFKTESCRYIFFL